MGTIDRRFHGILPPWLLFLPFIIWFYAWLFWEARHYKREEKRLFWIMIAAGVVVFALVNWFIITHIEILDMSGADAWTGLEIVGCLILSFALDSYNRH